MQIVWHQKAYKDIVEATGKKNITIRRYFYINKLNPTNEEDKMNYIKAVQMWKIKAGNPLWTKKK